MIFEGTLAYVILNKYPYNNGHLMVVPYRHTASLADLSAEEMAEVGRLTQRCELALHEVYHPGGMNVGVNLGKTAGAGIHEHLHVHLVPRWDGDSSFMSVVADTRVIPEDLPATAARLKPVLQRLSI